MTTDDLLLPDGAMTGTASTAVVLAVLRMQMNFNRDLSRDYPVGKFPVGDGTLIVSRGVGCSTVPVRLFCPAEVHLVTIA